MSEISTNNPNVSASIIDKVPTSPIMFYRAYSRWIDNKRESWEDMVDRCVTGLTKLGKLDSSEADLIRQGMMSRRSLPSGRYMWCGGTEWSEKSENNYSNYNCMGLEVNDLEAFRHTMRLAMQGVGTGAVLEKHNISKLPNIVSKLNIRGVSKIGTVPKEDRKEETSLLISSANLVTIVVGDSREGWVDSYMAMIDLAMGYHRGFNTLINVDVDLSNVRPNGEKLKGFGGVANPVKLPQMYNKIANILNGAFGRKLTSVECCLLMDEAALVVVAGSIRRCLPSETLVNTKKGLVKIEDVQVGDLVQTNNGYQKVLNKFDQGEQPVYDIKGNGGFSRATANHKYAVLDGINSDYSERLKWVRLGDLKEGDRLLSNSKVLLGEYNSLPLDFTSLRPSHSTTCQDITIPELDEDVAWFIGYTHGNGCIQINTAKSGKLQSQLSWSFNRNYGQLGDDISSKLIKVIGKFGITATRKEMKGENTSRVQCTSMRLAEYLQAYVKKPRASIYTPTFILQNTYNIRAAYLAGLYDSDGAQNNRPPIAVTTIYKDFARQITALYSSLGVPTRISVTRDSNNPHWADKFKVTLPSNKYLFNERVATYSLKGKINDKKNLRHGFTYQTEMFRDILPAKTIVSLGATCSGKTYLSYQKLAQYANSEKIMTSDLNIPVTYKSLEAVNLLQTWDIEVEGDNCFYADGYLVHNSASIKQFSHDDLEAASCKDNLWSQDKDGNWKIDPAKDALRMANHTRVYHTKPTLDECLAAVTKQYYSGEGAIQWAGEAVARANADLLSTPLLKHIFLKRYASSVELARDFITGLVVSNHKKSNLSYRDLSQEIKVEVTKEIDHRMKRYSANPCFSAGTMVMTKEGHFPIEDLVGKVVEIWDGDTWVTIDNFRVTGKDQPVFTVKLHDGQEITATDYHSFVLEDGNRKLLKDLLPGDKLLTHDVTIEGSIKEDAAYLKGFLIGDGSNAQGKELQGLAQQDLLSWGTTAKVTLPKEVYNWDKHSKLELIAGILDSDGTCLDSSNGYAYQIVSIHLSFLKDFSLLLKTLGVQSTISKGGKGGLTDFGKGGLYQTKESFRLTISQVGAKKLSSQCNFSRLKSLAGKKSTYNLKPRWNKVKSITFSHIADEVYCCTVPVSHQFSLSNGVTIGQCFEIISSDFLCNLASVQINNINPLDLEGQISAFKSGAISVSSLLHHSFDIPRFQYSRELDPIVGVSITGLFDFFVNLFGVNWLRWWENGRVENWGRQVDIYPTHPLFHLYEYGLIKPLHFDCESDFFSYIEEQYLTFWKSTVFDGVDNYCKKHQLKTPNRCTTIQPHGSTSLLTGASPGWHPPKASQYIRRMTFTKGAPIALAAMDMGYNVIPSQTSIDEQGNLLDDIYHPLCQEWLVEIPCQVSWAELPGVSEIDISKFSALAQFDFYMQVQKFYTTHTTSATIEYREDEVELLANRIHKAIQDDEGYVGVALLARFDNLETFPRLPFEPVTLEKYKQLVEEVKSKSNRQSFESNLAFYDQGMEEEAGLGGCDGGKCEVKGSLGK